MKISQWIALSAFLMPLSAFSDVGDAECTIGLGNKGLMVTVMAEESETFDYEGMRFEIFNISACPHVGITDPATQVEAESWGETNADHLSVKLKAGTRVGSIICNIVQN